MVSLPPTFQATKEEKGVCVCSCAISRIVLLFCVAKEMSLQCQDKHGQRETPDMNS